MRKLIQHSTFNIQHVWLALLLGLGLRMILWGNIPRTGLISDEGEYLSAAAWLVEGRGFDWYQGYLWTRAPLYPLIVAAHLWLFGSVQSLYITQIILSLLQIILVYFLAARLSPDRRIAAAAAILTALYLPLALYTQIALSETVYITLLLAAFLALDMSRGRGSGVRGRGLGGRITVQTQDIASLRNTQHSILKIQNSKLNSSLFVLAGLLFGLATLTRSLTLGFLPLLVLWLVWQHRSRAEASCSENNHEVKLEQHDASAQHAQSKLNRTDATSCVSMQHSKCTGTDATSCVSTQHSTLIFILALLLILLPWTAYNSRLYGGPVIVDTSGAYNLLLGGRTAYDGKRSDAQVRDYVLGLLGQPQSAPVQDSCKAYPGQLPSQAARQSAMSAEGLCLMAARPAAFVQKSLVELIDLFQINYTGAERFTNGFSTGRLPAWYVLMLFILDDTLYVLSLPLAVLGWAAVRGQGSGVRGQERHKTQDTRHETQSISVEAQDVASLHNIQHSTFNIQHSSSSLPTLIGLWWLYNLMVAPLLFAINRFRVPLMPFAFMFVPFGCVWLWQRMRHTRKTDWWMLLSSILALLLFLVATAPYAYLEPRAAGQDSRWASYLGPYPSSLDITGKALQARSKYVADQHFAQALSQGSFAEASTILQSGAVGEELRRLGPALLQAHQANTSAALQLLPDPAQIDANKDVAAAVLHGDLLRSQGNTEAALAQLSMRYVDDANPLEWAWRWLRPTSTREINLGGSLDIGYVRGCYPGEGDPAAGGNFRWCTDAAQLRFPGAGLDAPQTLILRVDARAWKLRASQAPELSVWLDGRLLATVRPSLDEPEELSFEVPATAAGQELIFTLHSQTFVPDAARYNSQQGSDVVGQVQYLGMRIDWARLDSR